MSVSLLFSIQKNRLKYICTVCTVQCYCVKYKRTVCTVLKYSLKYKCTVYTVQYCTVMARIALPAKKFSKEPTT